jgi:hypothetical protein
MTATQLLVVPKSMPMTLAMSKSLSSLPLFGPVQAAEMLISVAI